MKLCIHCKYITPAALGEYNENSRCSFDRPISLVTGTYKPDTTLPFAELERHATGRCTPLANNFQPSVETLTNAEEEELMRGMPHV